MYTFVIVIHVVACFILIAVILLQSGRGSGLSGLFGAGATQTIFGARASTFLTRTTTMAAIAFLLTCISLTIFSSRRGRSLLEKAPEVSEEPLTKTPAQTIFEEIETETEEIQEEKPDASAAEAELPIPQE